jgi:hypothetical protein
MCRKQELHPSIYAIILCLTGSSDNLRTVQRGPALWERDRVYEPVRSAHLSGQIPQLPSADSNERYIHTHAHTHARIYRLTASRRSISFFIRHYTHISPLVVPNTSCLRGSRSQLDRNFFVCSEVFYKPCAIFWSLIGTHRIGSDPSCGSYFERRLNIFLILLFPV